MVQPKPSRAKPRKKAASAAKPASKAQPAPAGSKAPKPSRTGALARPVHVDVTVDRAMKRQWDEAVARLGAAKREGAGAFDELWETVGRIIEHEPPLYLAGGFSSARAFLKEHLGENERTAQRLIRVAKYASPAEEARYGVSKLDAALAYVEATAGGPAKGRLPVDFARLRIPVDREGARRTVPLEEASVEEVRAACRKLRTTTAGPRSREPAQVVAIRKALEAGKVGGVKVQVTGGKVSLSAIPMESFPEVVRALARLKLPSA